VGLPLLDLMTTACCASGVRAVGLEAWRCCLLAAAGSSVLLLFSLIAGGGAAAAGKVALVLCLLVLLASGVAAAALLMLSSLARPSPKSRSSKKIGATKPAPPKRSCILQGIKGCEIDWNQSDLGVQVICHSIYLRFSS